MPSLGLGWEGRGCTEVCVERPTWGGKTPVPSKRDERDVVGGCAPGMTDHLQALSWRGETSPMAAQAPTAKTGSERSNCNQVPQH